MRMARQPNFLVAGAQKSGTSYLCSILARHPAVFHTTPKEPMFFQQENVTEASFASYLSSFYRDAANQPRVGEGSTIYFQWPHALQNIRRWLGPRIEIIVSLRQPTDRAVSFYLHNLRKGRIRGDERIADVGSDVRLSPVLTSLYAPHIERWLEAYGPRMQFLCSTTCWNRQPPSSHRRRSSWGSNRWGRSPTRQSIEAIRWRGRATS